LPKLLNIRTDLSSYKNAQYGYDRRGAGPRNTNASGQPYEIESLPTRRFDESDIGSSVQNRQFTDFILRGGQLLPETIAKDVSRLGKMFTDLKSPNGLLFTAKQEVLSRTGVNIKAVSGGKRDSKDNRLPFNNGIYLPTSTLLQAAVNPIGGHLLKQGINPAFDTSEAAARGNVGGIFSFLTGTSLPLSNPIYFNTVAFDERKNTGVVTSRLAQFLSNNQNTTNTNDILYEYSGGPGSTLGVGSTTIKALSDQRTGINNSILNTSGFFNTGKTPSTDFGFNYKVFGKKSFSVDTNNDGVPDNLPFNFRGGTYFGNIEASESKTVTGQYSKSTNTPLINLLNNQFSITNNNFSPGFISSVGQSVYQTGSFQQMPTVKGLGSSLTYNQLMTAKGTGSVSVGVDNNVYPAAEILQDFRQITDADSVSSLDYTIQTNRYEQRVNLGNAGVKNTSTSYVKGKNYGKKKGLDAVNALQIYKSNNVDTSKPINDLCKFRIGVIDNDNPSLKTYIHFRAFIDGMDDNYSAKWSSQKFSGRAESLYNYQGFDRNFSLSWTVTAQSKQELIPMYQKLNYLASVCAPDYSSDGYMRGNLIELTVGGYLFNQVGIMTGINYTVPMESPWEIAIPDTQTINESGFLSDKSVKELPFMIKVSGFNFIPIHNFVPSIQKNTFSLTDSTLISNIASSNANPGQNLDVVGDLATFGEERYISLANGNSTNY
jgi:hypothetical protein